MVTSQELITLNNAAYSTFTRFNPHHITYLTLYPDNVIGGLQRIDVYQCAESAEHRRDVFVFGRLYSKCVFTMTIVTDTSVDLTMTY